MRVIRALQTPAADVAVMRFCRLMASTARTDAVRRLYLHYLECEKAWMLAAPASCSPVGSRDRAAQP